MNDCISRQAVQDYMANYLSQYLYDNVREAVETIDAYIGDMPSVTPTQNCVENALGALDCISRQAVLDKLNEWDWQELYLPIHFKENIIDELPSVTPTERIGHWIPVSERLPEPCTFVNVTCHSLIDDREDWVVETLYLPIPKNHNPMHYSDWGNIPMLNDGDCEVIAWVERIIPEPYKVEPQESEE